MHDNAIAAVNLKGQTILTIKTVSSGATCEGLRLDDTASGDTQCWTGSVRWTEMGIMNGYFEGSCDNSSSTHPLNLRFFEENYPNSEVKSLLMTESADGSDIRSKVARSIPWFSCGTLEC